MKPAYALNGNNLSRREQCDCFGDCRIAGCDWRGSVFTVHQRNLRATFCASCRLCMKPAIQRIFIFGPTRVAHRKISHGGLGAVVRDVFDDSEARPAVCAVDEGIVKTTIAWIKQLTKAIVTSCYIRRDRNELLTRSGALDHAKVVVVGPFQVIPPLQ